MSDIAGLIASLDNWTPALVRKYEDAAYKYMVALVDALKAQPAAGEVEWEYGHDCDSSREVHGGAQGPHYDWAPHEECANITLYRRRPASVWIEVQS